MYKVQFYKDIIQWDKYAIYILKENGKIKEIDGYRYEYRSDIARLFNINITKLTKKLTIKYNAEIYGGRSYHSFFLFKENDILKVREYFESLIMMKLMEGQ